MFSFQNLPNYFEMVSRVLMYSLTIDFSLFFRFWKVIPYSIYFDRHVSTLVFIWVYCTQYCLMITETTIWLYMIWYKIIKLSINNYLSSKSGQICNILYFISKNEWDRVCITILLYLIFLGRIYNKKKGNCGSSLQKSNDLRGIQYKFNSSL